MYVLFLFEIYKINLDIAQPEEMYRKDLKNTVILQINIILYNQTEIKIIII